MGSMHGAPAGNVGGLSAKPIFFNRMRRYAVPVLALAAVSTLAGFEVARFQGGTRWNNGNLVEAASLTGEASRSKGVPDVYVFRKTADAVLPIADLERRR